MKTNNFCVYCEKKKPVKLWKETNEYVCLPCRLSLLAQEFEGVASKEDVDQAQYYSELLDIQIEKEEEQYATK